MENRVFNDDCMNVMKHYPDKYFDLAIVDPPYGINAPNMAMGSNPNRKDGKGYSNTSTAVKLKGRLNTGSGKLKNRFLNNSIIDWDNDTPNEEYFKELFRVSKNQIIFGANYFDLPPTRGVVCWDKQQPWENFSQFELIWTSFDCPAYMIRLSNTGGRNNEEKIHPTQKPSKLYHILLKKFAKSGFKIFDSHVGSGTIRKPCFEMGLYFIGAEKNKDYYQAQENKFLEYSNRKSISKNIIQPQLFR